MRRSYMWFTVTAIVSLGLWGPAPVPAGTSAAHPPPAALAPATPQAPGTGPAQPPAVEATDAATRMRAWERHQRLERESPFADLEWRAVGPRMQGGRIESIDVPAGSPSTMYVGVGSGNLWKTINNGTTWTPIFEKESTFTIGDVAVAPSDPDIIWVGTGEVLMARSSYAGTGMFKSTDAGETWTNMGLRDTHHIAQVVIHPGDPDTVWVAAIGHLYSENEERGVFRTTDGGESWQRVLFVDDRTGAIELVIDPGDPDTLYAAMWERSRKAWGHDTHGRGSGVYKSTDGGTSWQQLGDGLASGAGLPVGEHIGRIGLAVAPSDPNVVYALVDNYALDESPPPTDTLGGRGGRGGRTGRGGRGRPRRIGGEVYRSDDKGQTWRKMNEGPVAAGYDFCLIQVAPDNENIIYLPNNRFMASEDAGRTYRQIEGTLVHLLPHGSRRLHLDQHELWINPDNGDHMLLGNDGGMHLSYDRGASWLHLNNLPIGEFYAVSVDMDEPYNIYGGTQDDAALFGASDQAIEDDLGDRWTHVYLDRWGGGDSYFTYRDPLDPDLIYYEHQMGDLRRKRMSSGVTVRIRPQAGEGEEPLRPNWMTPFFISRHNPPTLYYGANVLFKSLDRGITWTPISPDLTSRPAQQGNVPWGTLTSVAESPLRSGLLYAGADDGYVQVTRDDGNTWRRIDEGLPQRWVTRLVASQHDLATVYVALTGYRYDDFEKYLYVSTDYGASWEPISSNLPSEPINVIAEDPVHPDILYVGTDTGVYVSLDRGALWHALCANLPTTPVYDLLVHPRDGELVIGTHGRSIFVADVTAIRELAKTRE